MIRRSVLLAVFILAAVATVLTLAYFFLPGDVQTEPGTVERPAGSDSEEKTDLTLYFRNNGYEPDDPHSEMVIPVMRSVAKTEAVARATINELIRGPLPSDLSKHDIAPVLNRESTVDDVYIQGGICVIHLLYEGYLPLLDGQSPLQAEQVLIESLVRSLSGYSSIQAVWLFQNGSPWQGNTLGWSAPLNPGKMVSYKLYFRKITQEETITLDWNYLAAPVQVDLESPLGTSAENCPFAQIIDLLTCNFDEEKIATLPRDNRALGFSLNNGLLTINLTGAIPIGHQASMVMIRSLVYTFTEFPEVDAVIVTLDGEAWTDGHFIWEYPLERKSPVSGP